eukprot:scaffold667460_cov74-Prasinocladus_malaysianus.AAC.1
MNVRYRYGTCSDYSYGVLVSERLFLTVRRARRLFVMTYEYEYEKRLWHDHPFSYEYYYLPYLVINPWPSSAWRLGQAVQYGCEYESYSTRHCYPYDQ